MCYVVIDVETTGLDIEGGDRVIEIGLVQLSAEAEPMREWSTRINPGRPVGATHVHGICDSDVRHAPTFSQVASQLADLVQGRVLVAHNLPFDPGFIERECRAIGLSLGLTAADGICTLQLAEHYLPGVPRSLESCAAATGIATGRLHAALDDARTTATLLRYYLSKGSVDRGMSLLHHAANWVGPQMVSAAGEETSPTRLDFGARIAACPVWA